MLNCTSPNPTALLQALSPVFELNSIRPVSNLSTHTMVSVEFIMFGILGVDEKAQLLTTFIWQFLVWENEFMRWDPEQCGSDWLTIPREKLWVPDIVINEFMEKNTAPSVPYVYIYSDGTVLDDQPVKVISSCRLDIYLFPFDTQNCSFSFNSYILKTNDMQLQTVWEDDFRNNISKEVMTTMGEWQLVEITVMKLELPSSTQATYQELRYHVTVRRSPTMYVVNLLLPSCFLIAVDLFSFLLPPQSVDRSLFKMTLILGYTMFLLIMNNLLPVTGNTIPLMNVFLSMCLVLMVGSLLETIVITNLLCGFAKNSAAPWILRVVILQFFGPLVLLPPKPKAKEDTVIKNPAVQVVTDSYKSLQQSAPVPRSKTVEALQGLGRELHQIRQQVEQQRSGCETSEEWFQMGYITDRVIFVTYIIFISVSFITIVIMWAQGS
ncbi:5-hydroxytryptamine receptor 3A-like [Periophthalmus magnuspinnatus]|uniref:5-hydroxytryptamine receptor 3A-like n=1 Tax=Periophthalmus magnuspinnatus TaxID=409849 RepID=UPI00145A0451|nr:5-hydroxytryptamine receptor 3A-like [Periophthalmus magnuspinnatus]